MSVTPSLKSVDQTRVNVASAERLFSQSRNLGNANFCNINNSLLTDEFGRPGNYKNLINTRSSDCAQYTYPISSFIQDENKIRPAQITDFRAMGGSVDTLGVKRDYIPTSLYNSSIDASFKTQGGMYKSPEPNFVYVPKYDPSTLRMNSLFTSSLNQNN